MPIMKKWIAAVLCLLMICSLSACVAADRDTAQENLEIKLTTRVSLRVGKSAQETGLRFLTTVSYETVKQLRGQGTVRFGTLVAPVGKMTASNATHAVLRAGGIPFLDIPAAWAYAIEGDDFVFAGSVDQILPDNYGRAYAGVGYISLTKLDGTVTYYYADWNTEEGNVENRSSVYALACDAFCDRTVEPDETHPYPVEGAYSPYTAEQCGWFSELLYRVVSIRIDIEDQCTATALPESEWFTAPYNISIVTNKSEDYTITLTVKEGVDYNFAAQCTAFLHREAMQDRITDSNVVRDPIARAHKYYISPDGQTLTYYYSSYSASY